MYLRGFRSPRIGGECFALSSGIPLHEACMQLLIHFGQLLRHVNPGAIHVDGSAALRHRFQHFFQRHVELEDFFEQFGRNIFRALFADIETFLLQQVLGARDRVAQRAVGVVEDRCRFFSLSPLGRVAAKVGMQLAAQRVEAVFEIFRIERKFPLYAEHLEIVAHAEKDVPQPQLFFAFGFSNTKPDCMSDSL